MVKRPSPTHSLAAFKAWAARGDLRLASSALLGALDLGMTLDMVAGVIATMKEQHFYKTMLSDGSITEWQDVYYVPTVDGTIYVKFRDDLVTEFLLLSFKGEDDE